ncbi:MAG: hypothetical protein U1E26_04670 [Coriobacteriia bacterium]|nr:hypothetical protein [Coriobacteriia bacterium]
MRIAVIQHQLLEDPAVRGDALRAAMDAAAASGAELVVVPAVPGWPPDVLEALAAAPGSGPSCVWATPGVWPEGCELVPRAESLGRVLSIAGDACFDPALWARALEWEPDALILSPGSESELQAEAALEVAIALSDAVCGLVIVAECVGAEPGEPGHGGSAIIHLGDVVAEAIGEEDLLVADVPVPVLPPEPREPLPEVPVILAQRLAHHAGRKPEVGYLADLSDGSLRR